MICEARSSSAVHDEDLGGELREEAPLLHRGVAATDDEQLLVPEHRQRTVADRAGRDALLPQLGVAGARYVVALGGRTCRDDQRAGLALLLVTPEPEGAPREIDPVDGLREDPGSEPQRLRAEPLAQLGARDPLGEPREILDIGGGGELTAGGDAACHEAFEHDGVEVGARCIDRGGVCGRAASDDDNVLSHDRLVVASRWPSFQRRQPLVGVSPVMDPRCAWRVWSCLASLNSSARIAVTTT
jgi:hypothetical protein